MAEIRTRQIERYSLKDSENRHFRMIPRKFGRVEDYVEVFICDLNDIILDDINDFKSYELGDTNGDLSNEIIFDPVALLTQIGYNSGTFKLKINLQRNFLANIPGKVWHIKEISPSRREIRVSSSELVIQNIVDVYTNYANNKTSALFFKDFILNFGNNINLIGVNLAMDIVTQGEEVDLLIKLYEPLPPDIATGDLFKLAEEIITPTELTIDLGDFIPPGVFGTEIKGPNFRLDSRLNNPVSTNFKTYDSILNTNLSSSFLNLQNALSSSIAASVIYGSIPIESGSDLNETEKRYHFENFIHFGSATERIKNFKYKLELIENYDTQIASIDTITGDTSASINVLKSKKNFRIKKDKIIQHFDGYERFLYFESGAHSWPKSNTTVPYTQSLVTSIKAKTWLGSEIDTAPYYGGQLLSSSQFDSKNPYNLEKTLPEHVKTNKDNEQYKLFVNMAGQYFDEVWVLSKNMTSIKNARNKLNDGISKDLAYEALKNIGIEVFSQFDNTNLFEYVLGQTRSGSLYYNVQHYSLYGCRAKINSDSLYVTSARKAKSLEDINFILFEVNRY